MNTHAPLLLEGLFLDVDGTLVCRTDSGDVDVNKCLAPFVGEQVYFTAVRLDSPFLEPPAQGTLQPGEFDWHILGMNGNTVGVLIRHNLIGHVCRLAVATVAFVEHAREIVLQSGAGDMVQGVAHPVGEA